MRSTTLNLKTYNKAKKELKQLAKDCGFSVVMRKRKVNYNRYGEGRPNFGEICGYCDTENKRLTVVCFGKVGRARVLWVLAHEVRHALHFNSGLYSDYYDHRHKDAYRYLTKHNKLPDGYKPPHLSVGVRAERDCDKWAFRWLEAKGIEWKPKNKTERDAYSVYTYHLWLTYKIAQK